MWRALAARHPDKVGVRIGFDEGLAHRIEGGADMFLMPSRFEPCGLNQMYSSALRDVAAGAGDRRPGRHGENLDPITGAGTGFVFEEYSPDALLGTLRRALETYQNKPLWRRMQVAGMAQGFFVGRVGAGVRQSIWRRDRLSTGGRQCFGYRAKGEEDGI